MADDFSMWETLMGWTPPGQSLRAYLRSRDAPTMDPIRFPGQNALDRGRADAAAADQRERQRLAQYHATPAPTPMGQTQQQPSALDVGQGINPMPPGMPQQQQAPQRAGGAIPGAVAAASGQPPATPYSGVIGGLEERRKRAMDELEKYSQPPDYSAMQDYARTRNQTFLPQALAATLMGMGPQAAQPLAKIGAGLAEEAVSPLKVAGGFISPSGKAMIDPGYLREKEQERINTNLRNIDAMLSQTISREQHDALLQEQVKLRKQQAAIAHADRQAALQANRWKEIKDDSGATIGFFDTHAKDPGASRIMFDPSGAGTKDELGKRATAEHRNAYGSGAMGLENGARLLDALSDPAKGQEFGLFKGGAAQLQSVTGIPIHDWVSTPQNQALRAEVMNNAYQVIHQLAGAALSAGEASRIMQFAPGPRDSLQSIQAKLEAAMTMARSTRSTLRRMYGLRDVEQFGGSYGLGGGGNPDDQFLRKEGR